MKWLLIVWACFVVRGVFYATLLPMWEGYDEYSHFAYVQHLVSHGRVPIPAVTGQSAEVEESLRLTPLPWLRRDVASGALAHDDFWQLAPEVRADRIARLQHSSASRAESPAAELLYEIQQPPLYHFLLSPVLRAANGLSLPSRVFVLRIVSILIASAALPFGFAIARRVFGNDGAAVGIVAFAAVMPEAFINFARVGNECLSLLAYSVLAWACIRIAQDGLTRKLSAMVAIALSAGLITKAYFLTAIPVVVIVYLCARPLRQAIAHLAAVLALSGAASFWWYRLIYLTTGDLTGQIQSVELQAVPWSDRIHAALHLNWLRALDSTAFSYIWFGGWSFLQLRSWIYHSIYVVLLAGVCGVFLLAWRRRAAERSIHRRPLLVLAMFLIAFCGALAYHVTLSQIGLNLPMTCGWYLYCLLFAEAALLCAGLCMLLPQRAGPWIAPSLAALFAIVDVYGVHFLLLPYYTGLIRHRPGGSVPVAGLQTIVDTGLGEITSRILLNRPYLAGGAEFWFLWAMYIAATVTCVAVAVRARACPARPTPHAADAAHAPKSSS